MKTAFAALLVLSPAVALAQPAQHVPTDHPLRTIFPGMAVGLPLYASDMLSGSSRDALGLRGDVSETVNQSFYWDGQEWAPPMSTLTTLFDSDGFVTRMANTKFIPEEFEDEDDEPYEQVGIGQKRIETVEVEDGPDEIVTVLSMIDEDSQPMGEERWVAFEGGALRSNSISSFGEVMYLAEAVRREGTLAEIRITMDGAITTAHLDEQGRITAIDQDGKRTTKFDWPDGRVVITNLRDGEVVTLDATLDEFGDAISWIMPHPFEDMQTEYRRTITRDDHGNWTEILEEIRQAGGEWTNAHRATQQLSYRDAP